MQLKKAAYEIDSPDFLGHYYLSQVEKENDQYGSNDENVT